MERCPHCNRKIERSPESHRHFFRCVQTVFENLPPDRQAHFGSPDNLRKWALVSEGFCNMREYAASTPEEASRVARFIKSGESYAVVTIKGNCLQVFTPQSQSLKAMGRRVFEQSKDRTLQRLANMIGTDADTLRANAGVGA